MKPTPPLDLTQLTVDEIARLVRDGNVSLLAAAHELQRRGSDRPRPHDMQMPVRKLRTFER